MIGGLSIPMHNTSTYLLSHFIPMDNNPPNGILPLLNIQTFVCFIYLSTIHGQLIMNTHAHVYTIKASIYKY